MNINDYSRSTHLKVVLAYRTGVPIGTIAARLELPPEQIEQVINDVDLFGLNDADYEELGKILDDYLGIKESLL